ncbi:MAG: hypothetical protein HN705_17520 [Rhodospirillales bacterium]|nr:hypothetical protein [Rhodospirillales bacterium]
MARDEYNSDHITRTQELRRAGVRSLGILHGMSTAPRVYPHIRYLDFDLLYVFGRHQHEAYKETWPTTMAVKPTGCFSLTRAQIERLGAARSQDIIIFANQVSDNDAYIKICAEIARHYTDRTVYLKLKYHRDYITPRLYDRYLEVFGEQPDNVVISEILPYELLLQAGYSFSGLSTVVAEALQMGVTSYFIDTYEEDKDVVFRDFPDLCVSTAAQAIENIRLIENGNSTYPRQKFSDLIDLSENNIFDVIRSDASLPRWQEKLHTEAA